MRDRLRTVLVAGVLGVAVSPWLGAPSAYAGISFDVSIAKSHTGNFTVGQNGTFTITLHNNGSSATGSDPFTVTDTLPTGLTYVSDTGASAGFTCNANGQTVTCTGVPSLANGADVSFTLTVSVHAAARPSKTNSVSFTDENDTDTNTDNNTDTDTVNVDPAPTQTPSPTATPSSTPSPAHSSSPTPTASVAGERNQLPATGFPTGVLVLVALVLIVLGSVGYSFLRSSRRAH